MVDEALGRIEELKSEVVEVVLRFIAQSDWNTFVTRYIATDITSEEAFEATGDHGSSEDIWDAPAEIGSILRDLREAMSTSAHGAWYSCKLVVDKSGQYDFEFDYDGMPDWDIWPTDDAYFEDLKKFPRPWNEVPAWHPVKKRFADEASWNLFAEFLA